MWGRSVCYRFAAVTPFPLLEYGGFEGINYGWLRRIASASLLQFLEHPEFLENGVPTMGFYGPFAPAVQIYSCRGSVYWASKAFLGLLLPENSAYWTAVENEGPWNGMKQGTVNAKLQPATGLLIANYPNSGASEMRSWCHERVANDWQLFRSSENYNKLAYNTDFPWMADGKHGEISMNYGVKNKKNEWEVLRLYDFKSFDEGVYRRDAVLETDTTVRFQLADILLPDGILRVDKVSVGTPTDICLGHYTLPETDTVFYEKEAVCGVKGSKPEISYQGNGSYELAQIPLAGWTTETQTIYPEGLHPVSHRCLLPILRDRIADSRIFVTLQLWKKSGEKGSFTKEELNPVKSVKISSDNREVTIRLRNGEKKTVSFDSHKN